MTDAERHPGDEPVREPAVEGAADPTALPADAGDDAERHATGDRDEQVTGQDEPGSDPTAGGVSLAEVPPEEDFRSREELLMELLEAESRRDEYLDDLRRARAEFDNFRRRTMKEGATQRELGKAEVLSGMLEVLDDLDRTLEAADASEDAGLAKGVGLVAGKLVQALQAQGLERIDAVGVPFDPNLHEAVQQVGSDDGSEPTIKQVLRPGYRAGDRVLRAAMVVVEQ